MSDPTLEPLLHSDEEGEVAPSRLDSPKSPTPLPWFQFSIAVLADLVSALNAGFMSPYFPELVGGLDIVDGDLTKVGYYVGLFTTCRNMAGTIAIFPLSWLSDHIGRKSIILLGMVASAVSTLCFGFSGTYWGLVISACFGNLLNFNTGVVKTVVAEITDSTNRASGFSILVMVFSLGATLSNIIGGELARPSDRFPAVFTGQFWKQYPYFLPCLVVSTITILSTLVVVFFLKETLPRSSLSRDSEQSSSIPPANTEGPLVAIWQSLTYPLIIVIANTSMFSSLYGSQLSFLALFLALPIELGGLFLDPVEIGYILATFRICQAVFLVGLCSRIVQYLGARRAYSIIPLVFAAVFVNFPVANYFARAGFKFGVWACIILHGLLTTFLELGSVCIFIFITAATPSQDMLGTITGVVLTVSAIVTVPFPTIMPSLLSLSLKHNLLGGHFVYVVYIALSSLALWLALKSQRDTRPVWEGRDDEAQEL